MSEERELRLCECGALFTEDTDTVDENDNMVCPTCRDAAHQAGLVTMNPDWLECPYD